jgi:hypothetical protein
MLEDPKLIERLLRDEEAFLQISRRRAAQGAFGSFWSKSLGCYEQFVASSASRSVPVRLSLTRIRAGQRPAQCPIGVASHGGSGN